ncbi:adenylate kinase [Mesoplasma syrphidae]|uniref:Adenylate kinase n=1 Tax=Mesoplasma syrphidae TaxID=225999 RepID=A0A2K9C8I9_9MOLU|nr:adenylate kinase [Mesoplasma syrphidae]AUF83325.1 adenylate kinase [Mesoplasma syrphidae]
MNIMLLGAPGSGKGTQAEKLVARLGYIQFSTGDLMRKQITDQTSLGLECAKYMNEGKLVPDKIVNAIVKDYLKSNSNKLIFDGFPRTLEQALELEKMLAEVDSKMDRVIYIDVAKEIILKRISGRIICPICKVSYHIETRKPLVEGICDNDGAALVRRPDDSPEKVAVRLKTYEADTKPLIDFYSNKPGFIHIEEAAELDGEIVYNMIEEALI